MADEKKRIIDLSELSQDVQEGQYILVDSAGGTGKMNLKKIADDSKEGLANEDGYYPDLYAGNLASTRKQTDSVPYLLRKTGGNLSRVGEREDDTLVGATVNVNQLLENGNFESTDKWTCTYGTISTSQNVLTYSPTTIGTDYFNNQVQTGYNPYRMNIPINHIILLHAETYAPYSNRFYMSVRTNQIGQSNVGITNVSPTPNAWSSFSKITKTTNNVTDIAFYWSMNTNYAIGDSVKLRNCFVSDLTAMFGSTIADYIYNLESATAGAGVAKLKEWGFFTGEYIPYNPGSLESVQATAHVMRDADDNIIGNYDLGTDTLRGLFKLDSENRLYADGDRKASDGTVTRKYGVLVIDENSALITAGYGMSFRIIINDKKPITTYSEFPNAISDKLTGVTQETTWGVPFTFAFAVSQNSMFFKLSDSITTIEDAKTWLASNPITVVYELATPTTEQSTPFTNPQICDPDGTEEYVTSNGVPVGHETEYDYDIKGLAEELIDVPDVPSNNGTYVLKATRTASGLSYNWVTG